MLKWTRIGSALVVLALLAGCSGRDTDDGAADDVAAEITEEPEEIEEREETEEPTEEEEASGTETFAFAELDADTQSAVDEICFGAVVEETYEFDYHFYENALYSGELNVPALLDAMTSSDVTDEASFIAAVAPVCEASDWTP